MFEMYREKYIDESLKTQVVTDETRRKISESTTGVPKTKTEKLLNSHKRMIGKMAGSGNPMYGRKQSEDTRRKISEAGKRRHFQKDINRT